MPPISSIKVIINARSGFGDKEEARRCLTETFDAGGVVSNISLAASGEEVDRLAAKAVREDWTVVMAGGGDGTINAVARHLVGTDKILGVLPLGTLNHFAKELNIPIDPEGAAQTAITGVPTNVDVGEVNGRIFLNGETGYRRSGTSESGSAESVCHEPHRPLGPDSSRAASAVGTTAGRKRFSGFAY
jgi:diacylglycerol kinase family enzyme